MIINLTKNGNWANSLLYKIAQVVKDKKGNNSISAANSNFCAAKGYTGKIFECSQLYIS